MCFVLVKKCVHGILTKQLKFSHIFGISTSSKIA